MPNIRQYENKETLRPDLNPQTAINVGNARLQAARAGAEATAGLGRVIGGGIKDLGEQYQEHRAQEEISRGLALAAQIQQNTTTAANNAAKNADPNDPSWGQKFQEEELEPILQSFASGFETTRGKAWAEAQVGAMRGHFYEKIAADQSTLAGAAAIKNLETFANASTQTVQQDPTSLRLMNGTATAAVEGILSANPNLTPAQVARARAELLPKLLRDNTMAAAEAKARANPDALQAQIAAGTLEGKEHLDAADNERLFGFANTIKNANEADARAAAAAAKAKAKADGDAFLTQAYAAGIQEDGSWRTPPGYARAVAEAAMKNPAAFDAAEVRSAMGAAEHATTLEINKTLQRSDPNTYEQFRSSISKGVDKTAVNQAYANGKLSTDDWRMFLTAADDVKTNPALGRLNERMNEHFSGVKSTITKSNPFAMVVSPLADQKFYEYQSMVRQTVDWAVKKNGMTPDEAAFTYLDPRGPKYLGTLIPPHQGWSGYQLTQEQQDADEMREGPAPIVNPVARYVNGVVQTVSGGPAAAPKFKSVAEYEASKARAK